jgi:GAF domain-containing protein/HAMP domain-containing protein
MGLFKYFKDLSLSVKLDVMVVLTLAILLATILIVTDRSVNNLTVQMGQQRVAQEARMMQSRFEEAEQGVLADTKLLASRPGLDEVVANRDATKIRTGLMVGAAPLAFDRIDVFDPDGARILGVLGEDEILYTAQENDLISFALLGIEITGVIVDEGGSELHLAAAVPLRDVSGAIVGGLLTSRQVDDEFLREINFSREDVHLALIVDRQLLAQDSPDPQRIEAFSAVLLEEALLGQLPSGQIVITKDLLHDTDGVPHSMAHIPLMTHNDTSAAIGVLVDLSQLSIFQRQFVRNASTIFTLLAIMAVIAVTLFTWRNVALPIGKLKSVAERMASGDYGQRAEVTTADEIGQLTGAFNDMAAQLQQTLDGLERRTDDLNRRSLQLQAASDVARAATSVLEADRLVQQVVELIRERFDLYYVGLFFLDVERRFVVLHAGTGDAGQQMLAQGHRLEVGGDSIIGQCVARDKACIALDVGEESVRFDNPFLPYTRSEIALPLRARGETIGALDVQSTEPEALSDEDVTVLQTLADKVAMAISNARLFQQLERSLEMERRAYGEVSRQAWRELLQTQPDLAFLSDERGIIPGGDLWEAQMETALRTGKAAVSDETGKSLAIPIRVRGQIVGVIDGQKPGHATEWTTEEIALTEALTEQLGMALEGARLHQETRRRAERERLIAELTTRMRESLDLDAVLQTAVREIGETLGIAEVEVRMTSPGEMSSLSTLSGTNGDDNRGDDEEVI